MHPDELAIRNLVETWMSASKRHDLPTVLSLMTDDVAFLVPGQPPFGKEAFTTGSRSQKVDFEGSATIEEIQLIGDWAFTRTHLRITITPPNARPTTRSGYTFTIFKKTNNTWQLHRDANLLTPETQSP